MRHLVDPGARDKQSELNLSIAVDVQTRSEHKRKCCDEPEMSGVELKKSKLESGESSFDSRKRRRSSSPNKAPQNLGSDGSSDVRETVDIGKKCTKTMDDGEKCDIRRSARLRSNPNYSLLNSASEVESEPEISSPS